MDLSNCRNISFLKTITLVAILDEQDNTLDNQEGKDADASKYLPQITVHQELLENSSKFFQNALSGSVWNEAKEKRLKLQTSAAVLQFFTNWLYCRNLDMELSWPLWIDIYLFACQHLVDGLASDTLFKMRSIHERWSPSFDEINHIYEHTLGDSPLRVLVVNCFLNSVTLNKRSILQDAPEAFVREFRYSCFVWIKQPILDVRRVA